MSIRIWPAGQSEGDNIGRWRRVFVAGMIGNAVLLVSLLFVALYLAFPQTVHTGDANLQMWLGPSAAQATYLALALVLAGIYVWAAVRGTHEPRHAATWLPVNMAGLLAGITILALYVAVGIYASTPGGLQVPLFALLAFAIGGVLLMAMAASRASRTIVAGSITGFWLTAVLALVSGLGLVARDLFLSARLVRTAWVGDHVQDVLCNGVHGAQLIGCEVGDDLGWLATSLLVLPILGLLIGTLGGAIGRSTIGKATEQPITWGTSISTPLACCAFFLVLMIVESLTKIW